jgi:hypothetical protein
VTNQHHYVMQWYPPAHRFAFWNRFGMPAGTLSRHGDEEGSIAPGIPQLWWVDPAKSTRVDQALRDKSVKMDSSPIEDKYWQEYSQKELGTGTPTAPK